MAILINRFPGARRGRGGGARTPSQTRRTARVTWGELQAEPGAAVAAQPLSLGGTLPARCPLVPWAGGGGVGDSTLARWRATPPDLPGARQGVVSLRPGPEFASPWDSFPHPTPGRIGGSSLGNTFPWKTECSQRSGA